VTKDEIVIGLFADRSGARLDEYDSLLLLAEALRELAPLPVRIILFHCAAAAYSLTAAEFSAPFSDLGQGRPGLGNDASFALLPQLEAACLPPDLVDHYQPWLAQLAVPTLIRLDPCAGRWSGVGMAVAGASPREMAGLLLLLATDPPTRRRTLDSQRALRPDAASRVWRVEGVFDSSYSLAIVNRRLAMALADTGDPGETVALFTYEQGEDPQPNFAAVEDPRRLRAMWECSRDPRVPSFALRNAWPPRVRDMRGERRVLANYAWEETGFPAAEAGDFNRVLDLITVVSSQTARFLQDAGVEVPIAVVGNGVEHLLESAPEPLPQVLPEGFRFLHISSCFPRKGADILLAAYGRAFRVFHDVVLVIKTFPNPHNDILEQLARHRALDPRYPKVEIIQDDWTPGQIAALYRACQVLVSPSRGEGFGLPIAEAMLHGLPVIATGWGGHLDFCDADTAWLIDYRPAPARTHLAVPDSLWVEPDSEHLACLLRELYIATPEQLQARLTTARQRVLDRYTWSRVAQRTRAALACVDSQPGPLPTVRVGWVSSWGSRCGIAAYSAHLVSAFDAGSLSVLAPDNEQLEHPDTDQVRRLWSLGGEDLSAIVEEAIRRRLDVVVIQYHWGFFGALVLARLCDELRRHDIKVVVDLHNTRGAPSDVTQDAFRGPLSRCDRLLVHTLDDVECLKTWGLVANVMLFPLCVYAIPAPDQVERGLLRQARGLDQATVLATYGYLMQHKGLRQMLDALPELIVKHPRLHLLMVNAWYSVAASNTEQRLLRQRILDLGLSERVTLETAYLSETDAMALLSQADLIVFPYQNTQESSSAAVRMAISAGRPIAVTPLAIFEDVAPAILRLPGTAPADLVTGIDALLRQLSRPDFERETVQRVRDYADRHHAPRRSIQLKGLLAGIVRQLESRP